MTVLADAPARRAPGPTILAGSLCTGYGGLDEAVLQVLGGELAWVADPAPGPSRILAHRYPGVPNLGDITAADWAAVPRVDIMSMGFPCTDIASAGAGAGLRAGTRSGLWYDCAAAIAALRPSLAVIENVRDLRNAWADSTVEPCPWCLGNRDAEHSLRAFGAVLGDLASLGFDAEWVSLRASACGFCHHRERVFVLAWPAAADPDGAARGQRRQPAPGQAQGGRPRRDAGRSDRAHAADPGGLGLEGQRGHARPDAGRPAAHAGGHGPARGGVADIRWGIYEPAIRRQEAAFGRPAPRPTVPGRTGQRLNPALSEWMMGLPPGYVTAVPGLSATEMHMALGNGVIPEQAAAALRLLLPRVPAAALDRLAR